MSGWGGHLRIEMRALPAGPTVIDMLANAAFLIGLSLWLAGQDQQWTYALPFERADHGFYRAAQHGLLAQLSWPAGHRDQTRTLPAAKLVAELVPAARGHSASRCGHRRRWAASTAAQSGSSSGSRLTIRSASSARRHCPEVTSGQDRPTPRSGPGHWRTSFPAERSAVTR